MSRKTKDLIYQTSAILILFAAVFYLFRPHIAPYIMILGVAGFTAMTFITPYPGKSLRGKRLFNIQVFAVLLMVAASYLMFVHTKEWVMLMLISALLTFYAAIMLPRAYRDEQKENKDKNKS